ncbi:MAG: hypothetical protein IID52_01280, partial [Proteobacteria bacterium]|nr:hypothetical protein [Pseudomonadota bacterium]
MLDIENIQKINITYTSHIYVNRNPVEKKNEYIIQTTAGVFSEPVGSGKTRVAVGVTQFYGLPLRNCSVESLTEDDFWVSMDAGGL